MIGILLKNGVEFWDVCSLLWKMPPITVVAPSATSTLVLADWVLIGGMPLTRFAKSAALFSTSRARITVPASVIWGVTFRVSTASRNVTVTVLFATVWIGIWTPCLISAAWLFWVVTFGVESSRPRPWRSRAVIAASR